MIRVSISIEAWLGPGKVTAVVACLNRVSARIRLDEDAATTGYRVRVQKPSHAARCAICPAIACIFQKETPGDAGTGSHLSSHCDPHVEQHEQRDVHLCSRRWSYGHQCNEAGLMTAPFCERRAEALHRGSWSAHGRHGIQSVISDAHDGHCAVAACASGKTADCWHGQHGKAPARMAQTGDRCSQ